MSRLIVALLRPCNLVYDNILSIIKDGGEIQRYNLSGGCSEVGRNLERAPPLRYGRTAIATAFLLSGHVGDVEGWQGFAQKPAFSLPTY